MAGYSELIKSFDKVRDYIRDFFIYGYKVRNEFDRKSTRTYDDEKRRIESWLGDCLRYDSTKRGKQMSISLDSCKISENPLYRAFYSKSFTDNDIKLHFFLLDILSLSGEQSVRELTDRLYSDYGVYIDEQTIRIKLKEYVSEGLVCCKNQGKKAYFYLSDETADSYFSAYSGLYDAVKFFSEASELGVIGNSILKMLGVKNDLFFIKHNYIVHTLEDEIALKLIQAVENKRYVTIVNFARDKTPTKFLVVPLKIYISVQTGRRFLPAFLPNERKLFTFRLDFIKSVKDSGECADFDEYTDLFEQCRDNVFGVSFLYSGKKEIHTVKLMIYANEKKEGYIIERLKREKRNAALEKIDENLFRLTFHLYDPYEIMHWAKSYIGRIVSIECDDVRLANSLSEDVERMYQMYCVGNESEAGVK